MMPPDEGMMRRRLGAAVLALALSWPAAATALELATRPDRPPSAGELRRLELLAEQIGWGTLHHSETMARAETGYGTGPWIMAQASPWFPESYFLASRAWAARQQLGTAEADDRLRMIHRDPQEILTFSFLLLAERPDALAPESVEVAFEAGPWQAPGVLEEVETAPERTLGAQLHAARGRVRVDLPDGFDWAAVHGFLLRFSQSGAAPYLLSWTLPAAP
ncbi:hypothetical protein [Marinimicrococcus flavescens]|uniref:Uncharacterized protein n=1 Tax=Marinimicrococcus flavescens TaxID=3031815 RepID=A0AAP3XQT3_9PROT|nr:hypothetical protein [Marinimicrococcus flavescens]